MEKFTNIQLKLSALEEVSNLIIAQLELDEVLDRIMDIILKVMKTDAGTLMLLDELEKCLVFKITKGEKAEAIKGYKLKLGEGIAGWVAQTGEPAIVPDVNKESRFNREIAEEIKYKTYNILCVPMKIKERIIGVIEVINKLDKEPFFRNDLDLLTALSNQAAIVIENNKLFQHLQTSVKQLKTLLEVSEVLNATKDLGALLDLSMRLATRTMNAQASSLMLLDEKTDELVFEIVEGEKKKEIKEIRLKVGEGIAGWVAKEGKPLLVPDVTKDPRFTPKVDQATSFKTKCLLCVPLRIKKKIIGIIEVINKVDGNVFSEKEIEFFSLFAHQVAVAIENAQFYSGKISPRIEIKEEKEAPSPKRLRLGEILMEYNLVTQEQIDEALQIQQQTKEKIGQILIKMGVVTAEAVNCALSAQLDIPYVWLTPQMVAEDAVKSLPREMLEQYALIPIMKIGTELTVVMADPTDEKVIQDVKSITGAEIKVSLGSKENILDIIKQVLGEKPVAKIKEAKEKETRSGDEFVYSHLKEALRRGATEIHFEPTEEALRVRYRIASLLQEQEKADLSLYPSILLRVKMIGGLDTLKKGLPQENALITKLDDKEFPIRVAIVPTISGESMVIELIPETRPIIGLDKLGFAPDVVAQLKSIMQKPTGMIIITGPANSGKSTTAYSLLLEVDAHKKKITTIEKNLLFPYRNPKFTQITLHPDFDNHTALGCALSQNSDVIMLSEVDDEVISTAIEAALSGKLVIAQMKYRTCFDVLYYLLTMNVPKVAIANSLRCILEQRLIPQLCQECQGAGCQICNFQGYKDKTLLAEMLVLNEEIRNLIRQSETGEKIRELAKKQGFKGELG